MAKPVIVILDDEPQVLNAVERDLRQHFKSDYRIMKASSGSDAMETVAQLKSRNTPIALFLVDQRMPEMTGTEFLSQARSFYPDAKKVLLSAYADTEAAITSINSIGLDFYLMKPSLARPIVLLRRRAGSTIVRDVAPGLNQLGLMLPYTPLHHLLLERDAGFPPALVLTSGNLSEEPIATDNNEARRRLSALADAFLMNDRDIHMRCDDSVVWSLPSEESAGPESASTLKASALYPARRSRGYVPSL